MTAEKILKGPRLALCFLRIALKSPDHWRRVWRLGVKDVLGTSQGGRYRFKCGKICLSIPNIQYELLWA